MEFFNKKEDVLDVQLTQYGKLLLSQGDLEPVYYAFFDDDILYDAQYAQATPELQHLTKDRIEDETPSLKTQYIFSGRGTEIKELNEQVRSGQLSFKSEKFQSTHEKHYALAAPLGATDLHAEKMPAWNVTFLKGQLSGSAQYVQGAHPTMKIPRLTTNDVLFKTFVKQDAAPDDDGEGEANKPGNPAAAGSANDLNLANEQYPDGSYIEIENDYVLLEIDEINSVSLKKNYDIEIFIVEDVDVSGTIRTPGLTGDKQHQKEKLTPLSFIQRPTMIKNNILLDTPEGGTMEMFPAIDSSYVEYYFNVHVDKEIDPMVFCENVPANKRDSLFANEEINCPPDCGPPVASDGTYTSSVSDEDGPFGDDC
jgi:hypothetical protein